MTFVAVVLVAAILAMAIIRPRGMPEIVVAAPAAVLVVVLGMVSPRDAVDELRELAPTVTFLAAILVLAHLADALGVFAWMSALLARGSRGNPQRLLLLVFAAAALTTAVLSLDATVVLLTPAIVATARTLAMPTRPHTYASAHLANSASTLLPVSNLTNLLAFSATGLSFLHFAALMVLPWTATILVEFAVFRWFFRHDLRSVESQCAAPRALPATRFALVTIGLTLLGFALSGVLGIAPLWVALAGAAVLTIPALKEGHTHPRRMMYSADLWFCAFVFALGIVVVAVVAGPVGAWLSELLPLRPTFLALLATAALAAVASNLVNNLPATLMLLAAFGPATPYPLLLALVIGVNIGPNLTYVGSLATMLWRRVLATRGEHSDLRTFTVLGLLTTPTSLLAAVGALWLVLQL